MTQAPEYRLVPVEPTDDMLVSGQEAWVKRARTAVEDCEEARSIYAAMLAVSPLPAAPAASTSAQGLPDSPLRIGNQVVYSAGHMVAHAIDALARSTDAPSEQKCPACLGNDADMPCGRPTERPPGCLRAARLATPPAAATSTPCASGEGEYHAWAGDIDAEATLRRAVSVMEDVLTDIEGWEDKALAEAVTESRRDVLAMADGIALAAATQAPAVPAGCVRVVMTFEQVQALYLTLMRDRPRPAFGWMEEPLVAIEAALKPVHGAIHDRQFNSMNRQFFGDERMRFDESPLARDVSALRTPPAGNTEDARSMGAALTAAQAKHLHRLLGWAACEVGQSPDDMVQGVRALAAKGLDTDEEGKARLLQAHQVASNVPAYIRAAIKSLRAALTQAASTGGKS